MPFQSEKQRRYLWANEPKVAADWVKKYGPKAKKRKSVLLEAYLEGGRKLKRK